MGDRVFTGDTLLIRGTGRTDFQNGDRAPPVRVDLQPAAQAARRDAGLSRPRLQGRHRLDHRRGAAFNPRLQVKSVDEYVELMASLKLPNPKMMDVAVPANMKVGLHQEEIARRGWALGAAEAAALVGKPEAALIDLRETNERERHGTIPGSLHVPYPSLQDSIRTGGMLHELAKATGRRLVFYCAFGERSAMAVQAAQDAGLASACHIGSG
jgi:sulfur dioxygenase